MPGKLPYRILLADDDPGVRESLTLVLEAAGYDVAVAEHGINAIFLLQKIVPNVLIYELNLPHIPGYDFLAVVRIRFPQIGVIAMGSSVGQGGKLPDGVFADAMYVKGQAGPQALLHTISELIQTSDLRLMEHQKTGFRAFTANQRARHANASQAYRPGEEKARPSNES